MQLTPHFTLEELCSSSTATRLGIPNVPNIEQIAFLKRLCEKVLEPLRAWANANLRRPGDKEITIHINSGYRCPALNTAVGGAKNSYHLQGRAADIPMRPAYLAFIRDHLPHIELINEGTWIHVAV